MAKVRGRIPQIGEGIILKRTIKQEDFNKTAEISGDYNPIHIDSEFCAKTRFKKPVAHGIFLFGLVKAAIWKFLESNVEYVKQELMFPNPTYAGEKLTIWVTVSDVQREQGLITLDTFIIKPKGDAACKGRCVLRIFRKTVDKSLLIIKPPDFKEYSFKVGMKASMEKIFTIDLLRKRADLVGDMNPIHLKEKYAKKLGLKQPIVPEDMLMGMISNLLGTRLPGLGTNWLKQNFEFFKPAYVGEKLTATVEINRLRPEKGLINLYTYCENSLGEKICKGEALVLFLEPYKKKEMNSKYLGEKYFLPKH